MTAANQKIRLFTVRLWQAAPDDHPAKLEWRGKVQSLPDGEVYYFRDWPGLIRRLEAILASETKLSSDWDIQNGGTS
jgi:hypothetical protein